MAGVGARSRLNAAALAAALALAIFGAEASADGSADGNTDGSAVASWLDRSFDLSFGLGAGLSIPGDQDLKVKLHSAEPREIEHFFSADVEEDLGPFVSVFATAWGRPGLTRFVGLQGELAYWSTTTTGSNWVDRQNPSNPNPVPPYERFDQHRLALIGSLLGRLPLGFSDREMKQRPYLFAGLGAAGVWSSIERGYTGWEWGFQVIGGGSMPVSEHLRLRLDVRYLVAPDADAIPSTRWTVDTSGILTFPYMAHYDTTFVVVQLGLEFQP